MTYHGRIIQMREHLRKDRLSLVTQCIIRRVVAVGCQFERLDELPLQINCQADGHLITGEDVFRWHFQLVLSVIDVSKEQGQLGSPFLTQGYTGLARLHLGW